MPGFLLVCGVVGLGRVVWWTDTPWLGWMLAASIVLIATAVLIETHRNHPLLRFEWFASLDILRFAAVAFLVRIALAEQTYGSVGLLTSGGLTNDQLRLLFGCVALSMVAGIGVAALTLSEKRLPIQVMAAAVIIAVGAFMDSNANSLTRPPELILSQCLIGFGATLFMGPAIVYGFLRMSSRGPAFFVTFAVLFSTTQNVGGLVGSALLGTYQAVEARAHATTLSDHVLGSDPSVVARVGAGGRRPRRFGRRSDAPDARRQAPRPGPGPGIRDPGLQRRVPAGRRARLADRALCALPPGAQGDPRPSPSRFQGRRMTETHDPGTRAAAAPTDAQAPHWSPKPRRTITTVTIVLVAAVAVLAVLFAWRLPPFSSAVETTENAYVRGRTTVIAPQVSGYVVEVLVKDYQQVRAGDVLVRIDDRIYRARAEQAAANLAAARATLANNQQARNARSAGIASQAAALGSAQAQLLRAQADMGRANDLVSDGSISKRERDQTLAALKQAEAQVRQAEAAGSIAREDLRTVDVGRGGLEAQVKAAQAQLDAALIDLDHTVVRAPEGGELGEVGVRLGQFVTNGTQLMSLVPPDHWVIADYKEAQTARMTPGQVAAFTVDALAGAELKGHVEQLSPAAGSEFSILKPDNATGNFVKVPQRIGVRISVDAGQPLAARLRPGMSVETRIDTSVRP